MLPKPVLQWPGATVGASTGAEESLRMNEWLLVWSWSLPSLSFSLYSVLRIFLSFLFWWFSMSFLHLLNISFLLSALRQIIFFLVPLPKWKGSSGPAWTLWYTAGNSSAADQTVAQQKELVFFPAALILHFHFSTLTNSIHFILSRLIKYFKLKWLDHLFLFPE